MDEIIMTDEQKYYTEIADKIDELSDEVQVFVLWYLLQSYSKFVGVEEILERTPESASDELIRLKAFEHNKWAMEMRDTLYYAVWEV